MRISNQVGSVAGCLVAASCSSALTRNTEWITLPSGAGDVIDAAGDRIAVPDMGTPAQPRLNALRAPIAADLEHNGVLSRTAGCATGSGPRIRAVQAEAGVLDTKTRISQ